MKPRSTRGLSVLGVTHLSDLYPNVKYKVQLLQQTYSARVIIHDLGPGSFYKASNRSGSLQKLKHAWHFIWGHMRVFISSARKPTPTIYICYPGIFLVLLYSVIPKRKRPVLVLDVFISLYDTIVLDRKLIPESGLLARGLFWVEQKAFRTADYLVTDTDHSSDYLSRLFAIPAASLISLPLAIPPECSARVDEGCDKKLGNNPITVLFVGSMVPLQGIGVILEAANLLRDDSGIRFVLIGDGQEAGLIHTWLRDTGNNNLVWHTGFHSTEDLIQKIREAEICLGIFGDSPKAQRVIPYKIYYYAAQGKPFLTLQTAALSGKADPTLLCTAGAEVLAGRLRELQRQPHLISALAQASDNLYKCHLSQEVVKEKTVGLLAETGIHA